MDIEGSVVNSEYDLHFTSKAIGLVFPSCSIFYTGECLDSYHKSLCVCLFNFKLELSVHTSRYLAFLLYLSRGA
jgi:hypothetical protein